MKVQTDLSNCTPLIVSDKSLARNLLETLRTKIHFYPWWARGGMRAHTAIGIGRKVLHRKRRQRSISRVKLRKTNGLVKRKMKIVTSDRSEPLGDSSKSVSKPMGLIKVFSIVHLVCMFAFLLDSNSMSRWRTGCSPMAVALRTRACLTSPGQLPAAMWPDRRRH